jgi:hydroxymethylpyrimidine/phosphomethylpyrimidine kinase
VDLNQVTIPCDDYAASVAFYQRLGLRQIVDSAPRYARFETKTGTTLSIHAAVSAPTNSDIVIYFEVDDVDQTVRDLTDNGLEFDSEPTDQSWLWREAYLRDPAGNTVCIYHAGRNRRFPPWRIG